MKKILIIEDDEDIAALESDYLEASGFATAICGDGSEAESVLQKEVPDLVLLDIMLPGVDGFQLMKRLRALTDVPIFFVSARREEIDKIRGLGLGADDYIVKPFNPNELVARVKANLARYDQLKAKEGADGDWLRKGPLAISEKLHSCTVGGKDVTLANKEFALLLFFMENPGIVFSKEHLYTTIWGMDSLGDNGTVPVHIKRIRQKLAALAPDLECIETIWGVGYRFLAPEDGA